MDAEHAAYRELAPDGPLSEFVECFWTSWAEPGAIHVMPDGCADLILDGRRPEAPVFVGTMSVAREAIGPAPRDLIAVRFHPGGARALLGVPTLDLVDSVVGLDALGHELTPFLEDETPSLERLVQRLRARLPTVTARGREAVRLSRAVMQHSGARVGATAAAIGVTRQHLRRRVLDATGIGPKRLARIGRLRRTLGRLRDGARANARLAAEQGYFDQAHLAREFRLLTGRRPSDFGVG